MLEIRDLKAGYGQHIVLQEISLSVEKGDVVAVLGTNGAGKSTLLRCLAGLERPMAGSVHLDEEEITSVAAYRRPSRGMALVPEGQQTFPAMSVLENLWVGSRASPSSLKSWDRNRDRVFDLFPRLAERRDQFAGTLSGGERQMLAVGRALMSEPRLLMLDEPSHGLAPRIIDEIADLILTISSEVALLIVEQNLQIPTRAATRVVVLDESRVAMTGDAESVLASEFIRRTYLGAGADEASASDTTVMTERKSSHA